MFAPVAFRLQTYPVPVTGLAKDYMQSLLAHPAMHGNLPDYAGTVFYVLVTKPVPRTPHAKGLEHVVEMIPLYRIDLDIATGESLIVEDLPRGKWAGIPVPVY